MKETPMPQDTIETRRLPLSVLEMLQDIVKGYWWYATIAYKADEERLLFFGDGLLIFSCKVLGSGGRKDGFTWFRLENALKVPPAWLVGAGLDPQKGDPEFNSVTLLSILVRGRLRENAKWVDIPPDQRGPAWERYALLDCLGMTEPLK